MRTRRRHPLRHPGVGLLAVAIGVALVGVLVSGTVGSYPASRHTGSPRSHAGAPGPAIACTSWLTPGADVEGALLQAGPGNVICLKPGNWGPIVLTDVAPPANVTLAAAPGAPVHLRELTIAGRADAPSATRNLTVRGFWIDRGVQDLTDTSGGLVFRYDTIQDIRQGYGFYFDADGNGGTHAQSGVTMRDDRIDHVGECLAVDGGTASEFTFDDNVCGPGLGYGDTASTQPGHYIEIGGINGITVDRNVFLGPADPGVGKAGLHLNVLHIFGGAQNVDFSDNRLWHTEAGGQAILLQEGPFDNVRIDGNLDIEAPGCQSQLSSCPNYMIESADAHGLSFEDNTVVGAYWGVLLTDSNERGDYPTGTGYTITHNLVIGSGGGADLSYGGCTEACTFDYNVTDDGSAQRAGATHAVVHWHPRWRNAARSLPAGLPFAAGYSPADQ